MTVRAARRPTAALAAALPLTLVALVLPAVPARAAAEPVPVPPSVQSLRVVDADASTTAAAGSGVPGAAAVIESSPLATVPFDLVGVTWAGGADVRSVQVRVLESGSWSPWEALPLVDEGPDPGTAEAEAARSGTSPLLTAGARGVQVRVGSGTAKAPSDLRVELIDPGTSAADATAAEQAEPVATADAAGTAPRVVTRAQWGADESLTTGPHRLNESVRALVLHHTAGSNGYDRAQAPGQLRGVYAYHTRSLGWSDIGYNLVVDRYGTVYEGRRGSIGAAVQGAHAGGFNRDTFGISVMGDFVAAQPPAEVVTALRSVIGWKLGQYGVDPRSSTVLRSAGGGTSRYAAGTLVTKPALMGHRDVGSTSCPGTLYDLLPSLRTSSAAVAAGTVPDLRSTFPKDFTGDAVADVLAVDGSGRLLLYAGDGTGALRAARQIGHGWQHVDLVVQVGDWTGDGRPDLVARERGGQRLRVYQGGGDGTVVGSYPIGSGWGAMRALLGVGDLDRDGRADLVGVHANGDLHRYLGDGRGGFASSARVGWGFGAGKTVSAAGDFTDDGDPDLVMRDEVGDLYLYRGAPDATIRSSGRIGNGWGATRQLLGTGSWDARPGQDLLARTSTGALLVYSGDAGGGFAGTAQVGHGWSGLTIVP